MDAYDLHEGRFIQERVYNSAANAVYINSDPVPNGRVQTILSASVYPNAAETRTVHYSIFSRGGNYFPVTQPVAIALSTAIQLPLLTMGMELKLYPGDSLFAFRDVATLGSTMTLILRWIETDLPFYAYVEPLKKVVQTSRQHGQAFAQGRVSPASVPPSSGPGPVDHGGGGGGSEPV